MSLPDLTTLPIEDVKAARTEIQTRLGERYPNAEVSRGVIHDLVIDPHAALSTAYAQQLDTQIRSSSLLEIEANPDLADETQVNRVYSNLMITRKTGAVASGNVRVVLSQFLPVTIPAGLMFEADGQQFTVVDSYAVRTSTATAEAATDRLLQAVGDGTYAFTIPAEAVAAGEAGMLRRGTRLEPDTDINYYVTSYADEDFTGGLDEETNAELVARANEGIAAQGWGNRYNITALLHAQEDFQNQVGYSVIGNGQKEMKRDAHNIQGISMGGKIDIYARTLPLPQRITLTKSCSFVRSDSDGTVWAFSLDRDEAPGFYDFSEIIDPTAENPVSCPVIQDNRSLDFSDLDEYPDALDLEEGAYSRYQTGSFQFLNTQEFYDGTQTGTSKDYRIAVRYMPQIADLQDFVQDPLHGEFAGDALVRAPIPCDVALEAKLVLAKGQSTPDLAAVAQALADHVNSLNFVGVLLGSGLESIIQSYLQKPAGIQNFSMTGVIRLPNGTPKYLSSTESLVIPDDLSVATSGRTVSFYLDPANVLLSSTVGRFKS